MTIRIDEFQALVFGGMRRLRESSILLLRFADQQDSRRALGDLVDRVTFGRLPKNAEQAVQLGVTPRGFRNLGIPDDVFPFAFRDRLDSPHHQRVLGDHGDSDPKQWRWNGDDLDLVMLCYAENRAGLAELESLPDGFEQVARVETLLLDENKEHFGFRDGLSNPRISFEANDEGEVPLGEFIMGYPNLNGVDSPSPNFGGMDLGRDGSYLVVRQLRQDVEQFWKSLAAAGDDPIRLAAKMVGRWPDGRMLTGENSFANDPHGVLCPKGAHIRRANPRDALSESKGVENVNRHLLLRRGRPYGAPASSEVYPSGLQVTASNAAYDDNSTDRGLVFACLCSDISRQFEHVTQSWLNNPNHDGLHSEICPIASATRFAGEDPRFTIPGYPVRRRLRNWPNVVTVRGAAYSMLVSRETLHWLADPS